MLSREDGGAKMNNDKKEKQDVKHDDRNTDKLGLDLDIPSNYENSLGGHPKNLTDFEVKRSPGRI